MTSRTGRLTTSTVFLILTLPAASGAQQREEAPASYLWDVNAPERFFYQVEAPCGEEAQLWEATGEPCDLSLEVAAPPGCRAVLRGTKGDGTAILEGPVVAGTVPVDVEDVRRLVLDCRREEGGPPGSAPCRARVVDVSCVPDAGERDRHDRFRPVLEPLTLARRCATDPDYVEVWRAPRREAATGEDAPGSDVDLDDLRECNVTVVWRRTHGACRIEVASGGEGDARQQVAVLDRDVHRTTYVGAKRLWFRCLGPERGAGGGACRYRVVAQECKGELLE